MVKHFIFPDGTREGYIRSSNDRYFFFLADNHNAAAKLETEFKRLHIPCVLDFTSRMGWFVRVERIHAEHIVYAV